MSARDTDLAPGGVLAAGTLAGVASRRGTGNTNTDLQVRWSHFLSVPGTIRFTGDAASWRPGYSLGYDRITGRGDAWSKVTAAGVFRRLGAGAVPLRSALWRENLAGGPVAMWPIIEGANASSAASALAGGPPMSIQSLDLVSAVPVPLNWEPISYGSWLEPLATPALETQLFLLGDIVMSPAALEWSADYVFTATADTNPLGGNLVILQGTGAGTVASPRTDWIFAFTNGQWGLARRVVAGGLTDTTISSGPIDYLTGRIHHARLIMVRNGADVDWEIRLNNAVLAAGTLAATSWSPLTRVLGSTGTTGTGRTSIGFITIWDRADPPFNAASAAVVGRAGERAADRAARLLDEEDVPFELVGTAADTEVMGPQPLDTLLGHLAEIRRTDGGLVYETRHAPGVTYRTRRDLYQTTGQPPVLPLDWAAGHGHITAPLDPDIGGSSIRNDITVKRTDGSFARAVQETGPRNVASPQDDPEGVGRYQVEVPVNPDSDTVLSGHATWRRGLGTDPATVYPAVTVNLTENPAGPVAVAASRMDLGDPLTLDGLPDEPDQARQMALAYTETIGSHTRDIVFEAVSASRWQVFVLDVDRLAATGSTLANNETTTGTAWEPTTPAGSALWSTTDEPYDIVAAGERVTVTAMTGASSPQAATVTRSVNGVVKAQSAGEPVQIAEPRVLAL